MSQTTKTRTRTYENAEGRRTFMFTFDHLSPMVANNAFDAHIGAGNDIIDELNTLADSLTNLGVGNDVIENALNDALRYFGFVELWSPDTATA